MRSALLVATVLGSATLAACGDAPGSVDAATPGSEGTVDAADFATCEGACRSTALTAAFGATTRTLDRAYFGVTRTATDTTLHVEAYRGAAEGCPEASSPTPSCTLILGRMPVPTSTAPLTSPANLLDFDCQLLATGIGAAATTVELTPVAASDDLVALDVALTFADGTISGHLFATHCPSLDATE